MHACTQASDVVRCLLQCKCLRPRMHALEHLLATFRRSAAVCSAAASMRRRARLRAKVVVRLCRKSGLSSQKGLCACRMIACVMRARNAQSARFPRVARRVNINYVDVDVVVVGVVAFSLALASLAACRASSDRQRKQQASLFWLYSDARAQHNSQM